MSNISYISTNEIRKDLVGFLQSLASGQTYTVLHRSKPLVTVSGTNNSSINNAKTNTEDLLALLALARAQAKNTIDPNLSYKELYYQAVAAKHDLPRR